MSPGAHPARNSNGHLMYFPGAIVGATHVQADGDILYIGAPVGDASDILMQTDLQATRSHWVKDLITQRAINHVSSMSLGGREGKELFIFQSPNHIIVLDASGQQRTATQISANHSKKWHASLAANHEFVAVSYPDENLIRYYSAQDLQPAGEIAAASPEKLCFLQDTGKNIAFVSADEKKVYRIVEGKTSMVRADIADPVVLRRWKNTLLIGSSDGHYRQKENPEAHQRIDEESISPTGSQIYFVSPGDKIEKIIGAGKNNYQGPWNPENLNGVTDLTVSGNTLIAVDWPNRLVYYDLSTGQWLREVMMGDGSYYTMPMVAAGKPGKLWLRAMHNLYLWEFDIDPEKGEWKTVRLIVNTAANLGATQNNFYRLFDWKNRLRIASDGHLSVIGIEQNRTLPLLRLFAPPPEGMNPEQSYYYINPSGQPGKGKTLPRPQPDSKIPLNEAGLSGISQDGTQIASIGHIFSHTVNLIPSKLDESGIPIPDWTGARKFFDLGDVIPGLDLYQTFPGIFDDKGNYYGTVADRNSNVLREKEQILYWPGTESAHSFLFKYSPEGLCLFMVGKVATARSEPHGFVQPMISDQVDEFIFVTDRATPGQRIFTSDGLYVGNSWVHNRPEEVDPTLQDPYTRADIIRGAVWKGTSGRIFHAQGNINRVDIYEIIGLDTIQTNEGEIDLTQSSAPAKAEGKGLRATFYATADFQEEIESRVEGPVGYHDKPNMYDHTWKKMPETARSAIWKGYLEVPVSDDYTLDLRLTDDQSGIEVVLDGKTIITGQSPEKWGFVYRKSAPVRLEAGKLYPVEIRYPGIRGERVIRFNWQTATKGREAIPQKFLYPEKPSRAKN